MPKDPVYIWCGVYMGLWGEGEIRQVGWYGIAAHYFGLGMPSLKSECRCHAWVNHQLSGYTLCNMWAIVYSVTVAVKSSLKWYGLAFVCKFSKSEGH